MTALLAGLGTALILALASCQHPLTPPVPPAHADAAAPADGATCTTACENIFSLGCVDKMPQCEPACRNVQESGVFTYDVGCMTRAQTCEQVSGCQSGP